MSSQSGGGGDWDVRDGDEFLLLNVNTGLFVGKPRVDWSPTKDRYDVMVPMVNDISQYQTIQIRKVYDTGGGGINTDTIFEFIVQYHGQPYTFHSPAFTASEIASDPPVRLTLVNNEPPESLHTQWLFTPASLEQQKRNDPVLHYGMPIYLMKRAQRRYLRLDTWNQWVSIYRLPVTNDEMDPWLMIPTRAIHVCLSARGQQCHFLEGVNVSHSMMTCKYVASSSNSGGIACFDDEGDPVYKTAEECKDKCRWPTYVCSGEPHYQCTMQLAAPGTQWIDYDTCVLNCINPTLQQKAKAKALLLETKQRQKKKTAVDWSQWVMVGALLVLSVGLMAVSVYNLGSRQSSVRKAIKRRQ